MSITPLTDKMPFWEISIGLPPSPAIVPRMASLNFLIVPFAALAFVSCAGVLPGVGILAPKDLSGYEMDATGLKASYNYIFSENGTYIRTTTMPSGKNEKPQSGTWMWNRSSPSDATLTLDKSMVVSLKFSTRDHANASIPTDERLYAAEFIAPE
jgi:hypothetical protein